MLSRKILIVLTLALITTISKAQSLSPYFGINVNMIGFKSDYSIENYSKSLHPSYSLGCFFDPLSEKKASYKLFIDYSNVRSSYPPTLVATAMDSYREEIDSKVSNHNLSVGGVGMIDVSERLSIGAGIKGNVLLYSVLIVEEADAYQSSIINYGSMHHWGKQRVKTDFYKTFGLSVPVMLNYKFGKNNEFDVFLNVQIGVLNKTKGVTYLKEYDNTVQIGLAYKLWSKSEED